RAATSSIASWARREERPMYLLTGYAKPVKALAVSLDGARLFSAAQGQTQIWEWDIPAGEVRQKLRSRGVAGMAVSPDGPWLISSEGFGGRLIAWPVGGGSAVRFDEPSEGYVDPG